MEVIVGFCKCGTEITVKGDYTHFTDGKHSVPCPKCQQLYQFEVGQKVVLNKGGMMGIKKFELTDEIQAILIGSPHNDSPEKLAQEIATKVLALIKQAGYVKLANDQTFPPIMTIAGDDFSRNQIEQAQQDMYKVSWRKVEIRK